MWRPIAERLTRNVIIKRRLPERFGGVPLFASTEGGLRYWRWSVDNIDAGLLGAAEELVKPGSTVWDVGANIGLFSFAAAGCAGPTGRVLAVEPDTWMVNILRRSAQLDVENRAPVDVLPVAVSDEVGVAEFCIAKRARSSNYLSGGMTGSQTGGVRERQSVVTVSLDWLLDRYPRPDVVKIDVEGAEVQTLSGGRRLLSEVRPVIHCEVMIDHKEHVREVTRILHSFGYALYDADAAPHERRRLDAAVWNTLALPE